MIKLKSLLIQEGVGNFLILGFVNTDYDIVGEKVYTHTGHNDLLRNFISKNPHFHWRTDRTPWRYKSKTNTIYWPVRPQDEIYTSVVRDYLESKFHIQNPEVKMGFAAYNDAHNLNEAKNPRLGRCYELSGRYVVEHPSEAAILVHGTVINPFKNKLHTTGEKLLPKIDHAWVEVDGDIYDPVMDITWQKNVYEDFFKAETTKKYTYRELLPILDKEGNWGPWGNIVIKESIDQTKARFNAAKDIIQRVWNDMRQHGEYDSRYNEYQFRLWLDNNEKLSSLNMQYGDMFYPGTNEPHYEFLDNDVIPLLDKMETMKYSKLAKKVDPNDPLFILKQTIKGKTWEQSKFAIDRMSLAAPLRPTNLSRVKDEDAQSIFARLYKNAMGETLANDIHKYNSPPLSAIELDSNDKPTLTLLSHGDVSAETVRIFLRHYAGYRVNKFPDHVKVWRGTNSPHAKIRPGDFTTFDKDFARYFNRGKFGAVTSDILPSKDLRVYKMDVDHSELIYWPEGHINKQVDVVPSFREFWEMYK